MSALKAGNHGGLPLQGKFLAIIVGRNETALQPLANVHLSRSHSDVYIIGGVRKPLQLHCEGREAHSALVY